MSAFLYVPPPKEEIAKQYSLKKPLYEQVLDEVDYVLTKAMKERKIEIHDVEYRIKDFDRFYDKIVRRQISDNLFEKIEDLAGIRIICLYRSDLEQIEEIINRELSVVEAHTMRDHPDFTFGYISDYYVVTVPPWCSRRKYNAIKDLKCEIHVRTIAMHTWASISHKFNYKQDRDIPTSLKNDYYALSEVFYIADTLFEQFRSAQEKAKGLLVNGAEKKGFDLGSEINLDTMEAYLNWKFPFRQVVEKKDISNLLSDLGKAKITSYQALEKITDENIKWFMEYEAQLSPKKPASRFISVDVIRAILKKMKTNNINKDQTLDN